MPPSVFAERMTRLGIPGGPHKLRFSFRFWASEQQGDSELAVDSSLDLPLVAMREQSPTRFVPLEDRRRLLQNWATFLKTGEQVTTHPEEQEARRLPGLFYVTAPGPLKTQGAISQR